MKTSHPDGLILYSGLPGKDFMAVELVGGQIRYAYDVGNSPRVIRVTLRHPINDNRWHDVAILRPTLAEQILRVDNSSKSDVLHDLRSVYFDMGDEVFVGGIPETMFSTLHKQVSLVSSSRSMFCLPLLPFHFQPLNLSTLSRCLRYLTCLPAVS